MTTLSDCSRPLPCPVLLRGAQPPLAAGAAEAAAAADVIGALQRRDALTSSRGSLYEFYGLDDRL